MAKQLKELVQAANSELTAPGQTTVLGGNEDETPRLELYHAPFSICSQKVRAVLVERGLAFTSHALNLPVSATQSSDSYRPSYVRLRMLAAPERALVSGYTGQSSVAAEGFDPCVVPTLVDHEETRVVVDATQICAYLDRETDGPDRLVPDDIADEVHEQVALVDEAPHPAVLYGASPEGEDIRPEIVAKPITGSLGHAVKHLRKIKQSVAGEPDLVAAYDAKIARQSSAERFVYDRAAMIGAYARMAKHVEQLEAYLKAHGGEWACGERYTMADIMWSASLFRLKWLGLGRLWEDEVNAPAVQEYTERAFMRPSFRRAVIDWPMGTPPSPHIEPSAVYARALFPVWKAMREAMDPAIASANR